MNCSYRDIRSRIPEPAQWWDEHAVPRYVPFAPKETANIYARQCALVEIACQSCGGLFHVAFSQATPFNPWTGKAYPTLADSVRDGSIHYYGDPPNVGCCAGGPTMSSEPRRVLEFWFRQDWDWKRDPSLEIALTTPWVDPEAPTDG